MQIPLLIQCHYPKEKSQEDKLKQLDELKYLEEKCFY